MDFVDFLRTKSLIISLVSFERVVETTAWPH